MNAAPSPSKTVILWFLSPPAHAEAGERQLVRAKMTLAGKELGNLQKPLANGHPISNMRWERACLLPHREAVQGLGPLWCLLPLKVGGQPGVGAGGIRDSRESELRKDLAGQYGLPGPEDHNINRSWTPRPCSWLG